MPSNRQIVAGLIRQLASQPDDEPLNISSFTRVISNSQEGTIVLNPPETDQYSHVLSSLMDEFGKDEDISSQVIEHGLQRTIFFALDIQKRRQHHSFEERTRIAISDLWNTLGKKASDYECYVPVKGIELKTLPFRFGLVTFLKFDKNQLNRFRKEMKRMNVHEGLVAALSWQIRQSAILDSSCARTTVKAKDWQAAQMLANQRVRMTIDSLNFFSDLLPYKMGWLHLPEENSVVSTLSIVIGENGDFGLPIQVKGPFPELSFAKLKETRTLRNAIRKVDRMLKQARPNGVEELLLSSVQWAGRASIDPRREEAFLLFAIALESILLPKGDVELSYRLSLRAAHLLGATASKRRDITKGVRALYRLRSNIVHNGYYKITGDERSRMRLMAKRIIFAVLRNRSIYRLDSRDKLDDWFERKCLH